MPSDVVSQGPVPVPELDQSSQHGMETVQQVADTEQGREDEMGEGVREESGEEVISIHVESSENLEPSTSHKVVKPISEPVQPEAMQAAAAVVVEGGEGGGEEEGVMVVAADEQSLEHTQKPVDQVHVYTVISQKYINTSTLPFLLSLLYQALP